MKEEKRKNEERLCGPAEAEEKEGESLFDLTNAATAMECTGLIQVPPALGGGRRKLRRCL